MSMGFPYDLAGTSAREADFLRQLQVQESYYRADNVANNLRNAQFYGVHPTTTVGYGSVVVPVKHRVRSSQCDNCGAPLDASQCAYCGTNYS
jgi:hypothetical protein